MMMVPWGTKPWLLKHNSEWLGALCRKDKKFLLYPPEVQTPMSVRVCARACTRSQEREEGRERQADSLSSLDALCHILKAERHKQRTFPFSQGALTISLRILSFSIRSVSFFCSLSVLACQVATALDSFWIFPATDRWYSLKSFACCKILFRYSYRVQRREKRMLWVHSAGKGLHNWRCCSTHWHHPSAQSMDDGGLPWSLCSTGYGLWASVSVSLRKNGCLHSRKWTFKNGKRKD